MGDRASQLPPTASCQGAKDACVRLSRNSFLIELANDSLVAPRWLSPSSSSSNGCSTPNKGVPRQPTSESYSSLAAWDSAQRKNGRGVYPPQHAGHFWFWLHPASSTPGPLLGGPLTRPADDMNCGETAAHTPLYCLFASLFWISLLLIRSMTVSLEASTNTT